MRLFFCGFISCFHFTRKKRPRCDQKLPTGTSEQSSEGRLAKMWTRIVSIEPTCASRVLNDLDTTLFPLNFSYREIDTKLGLNPHNCGTENRKFGSVKKIYAPKSQYQVLGHQRFFLVSAYLGVTVRLRFYYVLALHHTTYIKP